MDSRLISFAEIQSIESSRPQSIYTFILSTSAIAPSLVGWWVGAPGVNSHSKWQQEKGDSAPGAQLVAFEQTRWPRVDAKEHLGQCVLSHEGTTRQACWLSEQRGPAQPGGQAGGRQMMRGLNFTPEAMGSHRWNLGKREACPDVCFGKTVCFGKRQ